MTISYIEEAAFKSVLGDHENVVELYDSLIDCENCKNYWLIKEGKENHVKKPICIHDKSKKLFDKEIKDKLIQNCK